jgi:hypothetical protein
MMYYKIINDREVFSDCRTIQTDEGIWISNPTAEQIAAAGWQVYVPPTPPPPGPVTEPDEWEIVQAVKKMLAQSTEDLSDEDALAVAALYPTWISKVGEQVSVGERYWYDRKLYKVVQAHTVQADWTPDISASLFTEVSIDEWPEFVQPISTETAYMKGDKVTFENKHYVSLMDYNTYSPAAYPAGWEEKA